MSESDAPGSSGGTEPELPDLVGRTVAGRYRVLEILGRGAMGAVYLARHERMGRRDALKVLPRRLAADSEALARFSREARNACHIRHPNVCQVYDFGETEDGLPFLAMEYVEGETLREVLDREGPLPPKRVVTIADQVTRALEVAHARGIVHRDLKPDNIMLTRDLDGSEQVKVVDFGIAKAMEGEDESQEVTRPGLVVGTPEYVSPEQLGAEDLDGRSDVYSLAVVVFRALTGELPFEGNSWREIMTRRLTDPPRRLRETRPDLPHAAALQKVLDRAMAREREERQPSAAAFKQELVRAMASSGANAADVPASDPLPPTRVLPTDGEAETRAISDGGLDPLPETRVGSAPDPGGPASEGTGGGGSGRTGLPRFAILAGAATLVLVAGVGGAGFALGWFDGSGAPGPASGTEVAQNDGGAGSTAENPPAAPLENATDADGSGGAATEPTADGDGGPGDDAPAGADDRESAVEPPTAGQPTEGTASGTSEAAPTPERASDILFRQLEALSLETVTDSRIRAARDTAVAVWDLAEAADEDRAMAAYLAASALQALDRASDALPWAERAVDLAPENRGFRSLRDLLRSETS